MISSTPVKTGLALAAGTALLASGPALAQTLGLGSTQSSAAMASEQSRQVAADSMAASHANAVKNEAERVKAAKAAKAKAEAARKAAEEKARKEAAAKRAAEQRAASSRSSSSLKGGSPAANRALGRAMCAQRGWSQSQCNDLVKLWNKESGWNHRAHNGSSGAYGIPQALPGGKMSSAGSDWRTNPATQIEWGLNYIKSVYGNPSRAWAHSVNRGWY